MLRSAFPTFDGRPVVQVAPPGAVTVRIEWDDLRGLPADQRDETIARRVDDEAWLPFALDRAPLMRLRMIRLSDRDHLLVASLHHIICDEWSLNLMMGELSLRYADGSFLEGEEADDSFFRFAAKERREAGSPRIEQGLDYWSRQLEGAVTSSAAPSVATDQRHLGRRGAAVEFTLDEETAAGLRALARTQDATMFMVGAAAFGLVLSAGDEHDDVILGTPIATRDTPELQETVGYLLNILPLRLERRGVTSFAEMLHRVRATALDAFAHKDVPFDRIVNRVRTARDSSGTWLLQSVFVLHEKPLPLLELPGVVAERVPIPDPWAKFDLTLYMVDHGPVIACRLQYDATMYGPPAAERLCADFAGVCRAAVTTPDRLHATADLVARPGLVRRTDAPCNDDTSGTPTFTNRDDETPDALEAGLVRLWSEMLGLPSVGRRENFFELGGHSLLAVRLFARIEETFGYAPPVATLFAEPTVERFAISMRHAAMRPTSQLVEINPVGVGGAAPFIGFPGGALDRDTAGGGRSVSFGEGRARLLWPGVSLASLARNLGPEYPFFGVSLGAVPAGRTLGEIIPLVADRFVHELLSLVPSGPYRLGGYSLGGLVALEVARRLIGRGEEVGLLALFDVYGPGFPRRLGRAERLRTRFGNLGRAAATGDIQAVARKVCGVGQRRTAPGTTSTAGRPDVLWGSLETYVRNLARFPGRITLFRAGHKPTLTRFSYEDRTQGWGAIAEGGIDVVDVPGTHFTILKPPNIERLAASLRERL